jgi:cathepsin L
MITSNQEKSFLSWMRSTDSFFTGDEYQLRLGIFLANQRHIREHNAANKGFTLSINKFAAMTPAEYRALLSVKPNPIATKSIRTSPSNVDSIDWRQRGCVNPVKDQGQCGGCWAFSIVQCVEGEYAAKTGTLYSLSEQQLLDCITGESASGCSGGYPPNAWQYIIDKNMGFMKNSDYPYSGMVSKCSYDASKAVVFITGYGIVTSETDLASKVADLGPASIIIDASRYTFQLYSGGIYDDSGCSSTNLNHAVGVVGFGTQSSIPYWIVRNTWGTEWGESGYIRMVKDKNNQCGIASAASYATL